MSDITQNGPGPSPDGDSGQLPNIRILAQFIRDLSFENPKAPDSLSMASAGPQMDVGVEMNARARPDGFFEVDLKLTASAQKDGVAMFHCELLYGGLFQINGVPQEDMELVLMTECPRYLFPFARMIISDMSSQGGFPPFMLDPIDFAAIYLQQKGQLPAGMPVTGSA